MKLKHIYIEKFRSIRQSSISVQIGPSYEPLYAPCFPLFCRKFPDVRQVLNLELSNTRFECFKYSECYVYILPLQLKSYSYRKVWQVVLTLVSQGVSKVKSLMEPIYKFFLEPLNAAIPKAVADDKGHKFSTQSEIDDGALLQMIGYAIKLRQQYGAEAAYHVLRNPNWKFTDIRSDTLMQYYYTLTLVNIERYDLEELRQCLTKLQTHLIDIEELGAEWSQRVKLLRAMAATLENSEGWVEDVLMLVEHDKSPGAWFNLALYFGSAALEQELYEHANTLLKRALDLASNEFERAVALCNLGSLAFRQDDWQTALKQYSSAVGLLNKLLENDRDRELVLYTQEIRKTIASINNLSEMSQDKFRVFERLPRLVEGEMALASRWKDAAFEYISNEVFEENLAGRGSFRFSNNLYEAIRYLNRSHAANTLLGNIFANRRLVNREVQEFINAGYATNDRKLFQLALRQAVEINATKVFKSIIGDTVPFATEGELQEFCQWLFRPTKVRSAVLGRVNCLSALVDYIPDSYIPQTLDLALEAISRQLSFTSELDFKRPGIKLLGRLLDRLPPDQQEAALRSLWMEIENGNHLARYEVAEQMESFKQWDQISPAVREELGAKMLKELEGKTRAKDVWYSRLFYALVNLANHLPQDIRDRVSQYVIAGARKLDADAIGVLYQDWLRPCISDSEWTHVANHLVKLVEKEVLEESEKHRSFGGYIWGAVLGIYLPFLKGDLRARALEAMFKYINASNLLPYKRAAALHNLSLFLEKNKDVAAQHMETIEKMCRNCLDTPSVKNEAGFWRDLEDSDVLAAKAAWLLLKLELADAKQVTRTVISRSIRAEGKGLCECLVFLGRYAASSEVDNGVLPEIVGRLLGELKNQDERVRGTAAYYLPLVVSKTGTGVYWPYILDITRRLAKDKSRLVRLNLVQALREGFPSWPARNKLETKPVLEQLKNDLSFQVRKAARGVWSREPQS